METVHPDRARSVVIANYFCRKTCPVLFLSSERHAKSFPTDPLAFRHLKLLLGWTCRFSHKSVRILQIRVRTAPNDSEAPKRSIEKLLFFYFFLQPITFGSVFFLVKFMDKSIVWNTFGMLEMTLSSSKKYVFLETIVLGLLLQARCKIHGFFQGRINQI